MQNDIIFNEAKRLHSLGFSILWLYPKAKNPIGTGWTSGPRKTWEQLDRTYDPGYNVGVRLGETSEIDGHYLACIDVDIKDPKCVEKSEALVKDIVGTAKCAEVLSGRGNGSKHLYCLTSKPFKMITVAKEEGFEICIYSSGRQMVLAPSIHPDTGGVYKWKEPLTSPNQLPLLNFNHLQKQEKDAVPGKKSLKELVAAQSVPFDDEIDISWCPNIPEKIRALIIDGDWKDTVIEDRSAYLLPATKMLISCGFNEKEVLGLLTDKDTYLGQCAFDHAQTRSRPRAAKWLWDYTVKKVFEESSPHHVFKGEPVKAFPALINGQCEAQAKEFGIEEHNSVDHGFYFMDKSGKRKPDYRALVDHFFETHPYKYIAGMGAIYTFNGTHYDEYTQDEVKAFAEKTFVPEPEEKIRAEFLNKVKANNVERRSFFTDTTEGKINFKNGVLNLNEISDLESHSEDFGFRGVLPYDYKPEAKCPVFEKWLFDVMKGDRELIAVLQEYMGYIIRGGDYKYHKALWLQGSGRNGKSTFIDVLKALIGPNNYSTISIKSLMSDKFACVGLDGKMANFSEETSPQELSDSGPFKNLTGDGELSAQKKFGDLFFFRNKAKLIMTYNTIPDLKDLTEGMLSRPLVIPFELEIKEENQDHSIKKKLFKELPGIFNFALEGWYRLEKNNQFSFSKKSLEAKNKMTEESCYVLQWVKHRIEFTDNVEDCIKSTVLYDHYITKQRFPFAENNFYKRLNKNLQMKERKRRSAKGVYYCCIKFA